jgi:hypothetical protein
VAAATQAPFETAGQTGDRDDDMLVQASATASIMNTKSPRGRPNVAAKVDMVSRAGYSAGRLAHRHARGLPFR